MFCDDLRGSRNEIMAWNQLVIRGDTNQFVTVPGDAVAYLSKSYVETPLTPNLAIIKLIWNSKQQSTCF